MLRLSSAAVFRRYALHARLLWFAAPRLSLVCAALALIAATAGTGAIVTTGRLVAALPDAAQDGLGSAAAHTAWRWLIATAILFVFAPIAGSAISAVSQTISARYLVIVLDMTMELGTHPHGIAHLEERRSASELESVAKAPGDWLFIAGLQAGWSLLSIRLSGVGAFVVLTRWSWWAPVLLLVTWMALSRSFGKWSNTIFDKLLDVTGDDRRRAGYFKSLLTQLPSAKEVRIFDLSGWLVDRYVTAWHAAMRPVWAERTRGLRSTLVTMVLPLAGTALVIALISRDAWLGAVSGGAVVTFAQAVLAMSAFGPQQDAQLFLARTLAAVSELARLREKEGLPFLPQADQIKGPEHAPHVAPAASIALNDVTFTYPSEDRPTLSKLTLEIPAGQSVALVGVNGVGKSTLIKLLCGLYRPDGGTVRVDDMDPGTDDNARRRIAVIFQDFVRYHFSLRENVGLGASAAGSDPDLVERALADAASASLPSRLERGWETVLSPEYNGGTDLSGGQWQRVALARAFAAMHAGAGVLILDEPASALDVRVEARLCDRFLEMTGSATTVLVSHRLSSVRRADRIVVLDTDGTGGACVVEDGSHEELLARGGVYADLFTLQAARFARSAKET